jgi:DNA-binding NarL/FixJ family response regulator
MKRPKEIKKIRLFIVEDDFLRRNGIRAIINSNSKRDIEIVGEAERNFPDLARRIARKKPDVVLIDAVLEPGRHFREVKDEVESNGIAASRTIRETFGESIKIVLCSQYPEAKKGFDASRADEFVVLNLQPKEFRQVIRDAYRGKRIHQRSFGEIIKASIAIKERRLIIGNDVGDLAAMRVSGEKIIFLHYLLHERGSNQHDWLRADRAGYFTLTNSTEWNRIKALYTPNGCSPNANVPLELSSDELAVWTARINDEVVSLVAGIEGPLIKGPGGGRRKAYGSGNRTYSLNSSVKKVEIVQ